MSTPALTVPQHGPAPSRPPARSATRPPCPAASAARPSLSARFTPVRSASGRWRSATTSRRSPASRSRPGRRTSGATSRCCRCRADIAQQPDHGAGFTRLVRADNLGARARASGSCGSRTTPATPPTPSRTGWSRWPWRPPASSGFTVLACPSTGNLANAVAAAAPGPASGRWCWSPATWSSRRSSRPRSTAARWSRSTALRRRQPARLGDRRRAGGLGVRQRQRPALLRRGLQDPRLRGRRAARLAAAGAARGAGRRPARS